jgi:DNA-binding PadR family transcriptional regulator
MRDIIPTGMEFTILDLLFSGKELYGLEIVRESNGAVKRGSVYVLLDRLEQKGFVISRAESIPTMAGLPRRQYRITGVGQRAVQWRNSALDGFATPQIAG